MQNTIRAASAAALLIFAAFLLHNFNGEYYEPVLLGFEKPTDYANMAKIENAIWSFAFTSSGIAHMVTGFAMFFLGLGLYDVFRRWSEGSARLCLLAAMLSGLGFLLTGVSDIPGTAYGGILRNLNPHLNEQILMMTTHFRGIVNTVAIVGLGWDDAKLPVLVHPTAPPGVGEMQMEQFQLTASIGFTTDTTLAMARMIYDGFFDRFEKLKIIAGHAGGTLPYLIGRLDQCYEKIPACRTKTREKPSLHARRIYADSVVFTDDVLAMALRVFGTGNVLYGSDYPHTIGDPIGCLARVDRLPDGARSRVRGENAQRIFDFR